MPAAKDGSLLRGHFTKEQLENKAKDKASVTPSAKLKVPDIIKNNVNYYDIWKLTMKLYKGTQLLNALDAPMLARYCIETHRTQQMYKVRDSIAYKLLVANESLDTAIDNDDKDAAKAAESEIAATLGTLLSIETRIEVKTKMLNQMSTALYMNPRARAGAIPQQPDKKPDDTDDLFDD